MSHVGGEFRVKTDEESFADWEEYAFGYGYGTGEEILLRVLKTFFASFDDERSYDYRKLETAVGSASSWFLINLLCRTDVLEYGTSPRFGWVTPHGGRLKAFVDRHSAGELIEMTMKDESYSRCHPEFCNCGSHGYVAGRKCPNPFWK